MHFNFKLPTIENVAREIRSVDRTDGATYHLALQVLGADCWRVHVGYDAYGQDARGFWAAAELPGRNRRCSSIAIARDMIEQVRAEIAECNIRPWMAAQ